MRSYALSIITLEEKVMSSRMLCFNWFNLDGARKKKRKLYLEADDDGMYLCPVAVCLHVGFKSQRGLRKHITNKHEWYYFFDTQPSVKREEAENRLPERRKASTHKQPAFAIDNGCGLEFVRWLQTPCGGGKVLKEAKQIAKRGMKFLMCCVGDSEDGLCAPEHYIDCCVGSPTMLMKFLKVIMEDWRLKSTGALSYMQAISDLCDFRKCHGVPDATLRLFAVTEVYLRRTKSTLQRKKNVEYSRNLSLETLIARQSWASLSDMEKVIPHHTAKYKEIFKKASTCTDDVLTVSELAFATRFLITFLLLRVKCTRPMSLQYLTVEMMTAATSNGGFVDQTQFKTADQFLFDTLKFSEDALDVVNTYINRIRPLCKPKCDYVILTTKGNQYTAFCSALSLLTHEALGQHITPTRYRQIVESESVEKLNKVQQEIISKDQKHSSYIARRSYQKKLSREVAVEGIAAMKELVGSDQRDEHTGELAGTLREDVATENVEQMTTSAENERIPIDNESPSMCPTVIDLEPIAITDETLASTSAEKTDDGSLNVIECDDIDVKKEELEQVKRLTFTPEENSFIRAGYDKYKDSCSKWSDILKDTEYKFHSSRTRDSIRMRANSLGLTKVKTVKSKIKTRSKK